MPDWHHTLAIAGPLALALALAWLVHRGARLVARRVRARGTGRAARIVDVIALPAAAALSLFFLAIAVGGMPLDAAWTRWTRHALAVGGMLCLTWLAVRAVGAVEAGILRRNPVDTADNLHARRIQTQARVLGRFLQIAVGLLGVSIALMTFPAVRQVGTTLLASAGVVGLVAGIAAKPVFGNLIAGMQLALSQPIRLDDVVIVAGEWGRIEEITATYVVVRIWDERRMVVPLQWFVENPFENWTRTSAQLLGTSFLWLDYRTPMAEVRAELERICNDDPRWDGRVCVAQVTETSEATMQVRLLVSARNSGDLFDLRCAVRERMLCFLHTRFPESLPRLRADIARTAAAGELPASADTPDTAHATATSSPGAEDVNDADREALAQRVAEADAGDDPPAMPATSAG